MSPLPAWVNPPSYLAAMQGGASIGTQLRGQDIAQAEAQDRLALAYQSLAQQEAERDDRARERRDQFAAANALRGRNLDMLQQWHQGQLAQEQASVGQRATAAEMTNKFRQGQLQLGRDKLNQPLFHFGTRGEVTQLDPTSQAVTELKPPRLANPKVSIFDSQAHANLLRQEAELRNSLSLPMNDAMKEQTVTRIGQIHKQIKSIQDKYAAPTNAAANALTSPNPFGAAANPTETANFAAAPLSVQDRVAGTTYQTPKGPHTWTGQGWTPFSAPSAAKQDAGVPESQGEMAPDESLEEDNAD